MTHPYRTSDEASTPYERTFHARPGGPEHIARLARQDETTTEIRTETADISGGYAYTAQDLARAAVARFTFEDEARAAFLRTLDRLTLARLAVQGRAWDPRLSEIAAYLHSIGAGT